MCSDIETNPQSTYDISELISIVREYEQVEVYPYIRPTASEQYSYFVAEYDRWKYTFEVSQKDVSLIKVTRPWKVGDPSPPEWVPAAAGERIVVKGNTRADIPAPVYTSLLDRGILGEGLSFHIR